MRAKARAAIIGVSAILIAALASPWIVPLPRDLIPPLSQVIRFRDGTIMRAYLASDGRWRIWTPLEEIDPLLIEATICYEDRFFRYHPGVNPFSLMRAAWQNLRAGRIVSGGSTLTMQLVRLIEPRPRTIRSKLIEILRAVQLELRLGKRRVLELYLNRAPYGGNFEGVGAASLAYFGKPPSKLSPAEVAYLVCLPQSPSTRNPLTGDPKLALRARNRVLRRMLERGLITGEEFERAIGEPIPRSVRRMPFNAPHAADYVRSLRPDGTDVITTLDRGIQRVVEGFVEAHMPRLRELGAYNASVVVIENSSRKIRALVGSPDYWDEEHGGQIIGFNISRSPGSALKPFLYALALQEGVITPRTALPDVPLKLGGFRPENFGRRYRGLVTAEEALARSLNCPFVELLRMTGYRRFLSLLERAGLPVGEREYGLTIITGGMEVKLIELTNLYVSLARGGRHGPFRILKDDPLIEGELLDPGAVSLTLKALSLRGRPDAPHGSNFSSPKAVVYWKTGTSWGRRDAWCIGLTHDYTVGVWVGNFSGKGAEGIVGAVAAAPLTFDILAALGSSEREIPMALDHLVRVKVCPLSGLPPGEGCPEAVLTWAVRNGVPSRRCPFHKTILVESKTGRPASPWRRYRPGELERRTITVYPPLVAAFMGLKADRSVKGGPSKLRLIHPTDGAGYVLGLGLRNVRGVPVQACGGEGPIFWFADGRFVLRTEPGEAGFLSLGPGEHEIVAVDSAGRSARARITVHAIQ